MPDKTRIVGNLVSDNNLFSNPTTDNTGIGTTNPNSKLDVIGNVRVSGIITATSFSGTATTATNVTGGIASVTQLSVSGITTIGLANTSTPPSNSQMSFELINNTQLRIKVRGTDSILRSADITLA